MFSEKIIFWGNGSFWAQTLHIFVTLDMPEEIFFNFGEQKELIGR